MERFDRQLDRPQLGRPDCARQEGHGRALGHPVTVTSESRPSHAVCVPLGKLRWDAFGRCIPGTCASEIYAHPDVCASRQTRSSTHSIVAQTRARPSPTDAQRCHDGLRRTQINKATALEAIPSTRSSLFTLLSPLLIASDLLHSRHPTRMPSCDRAHLKPGPSRGRRRTGRRIRDCVNWPTDFCCLQPFAALV